LKRRSTIRNTATIRLNPGWGIAIATDTIGAANRSAGVQSVTRVCDLLDALARDAELGVTELGRRCDLPKGTVHRLLMTLERRGYVERAAQDGTYRLGLNLFELGSLVLDRRELVTEGRRHVVRLMEKSRETVHLGIIDGGHVVNLAVEEPPQAIRVVTPVGGRSPIHCTSTGKAIAAHLPLSDLQALVAEHGLPRHTANTLSDMDVWLADLAEVRVRGFAVDQEEHREGGRSVGAPIANHTDTVFASISVTGPTHRFTTEQIALFAGMVCDAAADISRSLGAGRHAVAMIGGTSHEGVIDRG
jgi:DNA-binding IclR family transcriptional regulator